MKTLPLFYYPNSWVWVDDDKTLLETMALFFGKKNTIKSFQSARTCLNFLQQYKSPLSHQNFLISNKQDLSYGTLQHTPVDFDITILANLANFPERYHEITVIVIDYNMPEMDGYSLAKVIQQLPIQKILLTGKAQENEAINGFNHNLIHRFVQKGIETMKEMLSIYLKELTLQYFQQLTLPLLSYLETESKLPLTDSIFIDFFETYCEQYQIKEYYLADKNGSFLCIDSKGKRSCLVVQTERGINKLLNICQEEGYFQGDKLAMIQNREQIPFFGIGKEGWQIDTSLWHKHMYTPNILEGKERYFWATVPLE
ncbi:MAG: hypothetical protein ACK4PR_06695 [Gammaproteobacteria bacterium]